MAASEPIYAHSLPDPWPRSDWELLDDHAADVARRTAAAASAFSSHAWGECLGHWHDLGKRHPDFQRYIRGMLAKGPPHAWLGAMVAAKKSKEGTPIAFAIAGHHAGLADFRSDAATDTGPGPTPLMDALRSLEADYAKILPTLPATEVGRTVPPLPPHARAKGSAADLFIRFLFSALVDADRLATAAFYARFEPALTADDLSYDDIPTLQARLDSAIDAMPPKGSPAVIELRRQVLHACRQRADDPPGRFSLTVPTGGGKTLSAMSFALNHARENGLRRVIVVIPYTSIIEQSARVYRSVLGDANVLEHHSNLDEQKLDELNSRGEQLRKLAAENWDAPIVVTTTVQFFQSLLSNHPGRCRKLHNIAKSVVVLDEVQTLQPTFLRTILDVLGQLTDHYGATIVLATATPPALVARSDSPRAGLANVQEIMPDPSALARHARRVQVEWRLDAPTPYEQLAIEMKAARQALAIVHRRDDARKLAELIGGDVLHLSALMCPAHRAAVVAEVSRRLKDGERCLLVSTQLIEAGVDVDFPLVYRALAGLDSIAQSAGRCDREGKLTEAAGKPAGRMVVFRAETDPPPGVPIKAFQSMVALLGYGNVDPFEPTDSIRFFNELYGKIDNDEHRIESLRTNLMFATVAHKFRLIDSEMHSVVVPFGDARERVAAFRKSPSRQTQRALQPFLVQVRKYRLAALREAGIVMPVDDDVDRFDVVAEGREGAYHEVFGFKDVSDGVMSAEESVY